MEVKTDGEIVEGLPSALFLPLTKYKFKHVTGLASVTVPIRGMFPDDGLITGEYDISPEAGVILFGTLTQALLGLGKYPTLASNQRFIVSGLELDGENISVIGRVVEML